MNLRVLLSATIFSVVVFVPWSAAYSLYGTKWASSNITMQLQLGAGSGVLLDGFPSWGASAEDALSVWNSHIGTSKFSVVRDSTVPRARNNLLNNVFFSGEVYGQAWGTGVVAVTLIRSTTTTQIETDVIFNSQVTWNSYRGPLRFSSTGSPIYDLHRVALHEFGHALGLDHPDEAGQSVSALMNSRLSSLDALTSDDIAGAQSLYGSAFTVVAPPTITTHPTSRSVVVGQSTTFTVVATGTAPLSYQWLKDGIAITGATNPTFTLASATQADGGSYSVRVSNPGGSVTSTTATLTVTAPTTPPPPPPPPPPTPTLPPPPPAPVVTPPTIAVAPASQTATANTTVSLYVVATGTPPLFYQWRKDGTIIGGATNSVLSLTNVQVSQAGSYTVNVSNGAGSVSSTAAVLSIQTLPTIITPPADQTVPIGGRLQLSVVATGTSPLSYAWRKDDTAVSGASDSTYEIAEAQPVHGGNYSVVVTNVAGSVTSAAARITVVAVAPTVTSAPVSQTASAGDRVEFTVRANGTPPFTYQWLKDTQAIPGATSASLTLPNVRAADGGSYAVRVANVTGSATSASAILTVKSSRLVNLSTRAFVPAGGTLTPGFFIRGSGSKPLLIRAVGPTLRQFGIEGALAETRLELIAQGDALPVTRDRDYHAVTDNDIAATVGAFPLDPNERDSAVEATLTSRGYTVKVSPGNSTMVGVTLAEIYDADTPISRAELVNLSTLGFVGAGENVLTAGFVISGNASKRLLIRAIGPGLTPFGVADTLVDPQIAVLRQGATEPLAMNDNWPDVASMRSAFTAAGAFNLPAGSTDAAVIVTLDPGAFTVIVSSVTAAVTGLALVEIYDLDP